MRDNSGQHFSFHNYFVLADGHLTVCSTRDRAANERTFAQIAPSLRKELQVGPATLDSLQHQLVRGYVKYYSGNYFLNARFGERASFTLGLFR